MSHYALRRYFTSINFSRSLFMFKWQHVFMLRIHTAEFVVNMVRNYLNWNFRPRHSFSSFFRKIYITDWNLKPPRSSDTLVHNHRKHIWIFIMRHIIILGIKRAKIKRENLWNMKGITSLWAMIVCLILSKKIPNIAQISNEFIFNMKCNAMINRKNSFKLFSDKSYFCRLLYTQCKLVY